MQEIALRVRDGTVEIREGERPVWQSGPDEVARGPAYLYLQMASHSNYPPRAVYFERVEVAKTN